jgi:HD superfamily phosphohydrolase YqeK
MSDADSTDNPLERLTPLEQAAARGELPDWARATVPRRAHMARVATLLEGWAHALGLPEDEALRWAAAGWLHDVLRDGDPATLVHDVAGVERDLPPKVLHGPAAAARLKGAVDPRVLTAVRYHTIGHPSLDLLGRALYLADFLDPERDFLGDWGAELRNRMPRDLEDVLVEVLAARITHLIARRKPVRPETAAFWSAAVGKPPA